MFISESEPQYTRDERREIEGIFRDRPTRSQVNFKLVGSSLSLDPKEAINVIGNQTGMNSSVHLFLGGIGVTARDITQLNRELPPIEERLLSERKRIVFAGNGLSNVPLLLAEKYRLGQVEDPPVVVDVFDYYRFLEDFDTFNFDLLRLGVPLPNFFGFFHQNLKDLVQAAKASLVKLVCYYFGISELPNEIKNTMLAINCYGPSYSSIKDQLSMLATKGELYFCSIDLPNKPARIQNFSIKPIPSVETPGFVEGLIFKRLR